MKKVLVPIDGSKFSMKALKQAKEIAEKFQSDVTIITVVSDIVAVNVDYKIDIISQNIAVAEEILANAKKIFDDTSLNVDTMYKVGDIAKEICEKAADGNYDMIIMGSRGMGIISRTFLGSISHKVINYTDKSVLVVK
ncbi:universal stress protein [Criibacterium bergeronii]|mgnify:CR=1 FL=1|uniref:Universal stress protein n=1 Tax=Criibacterium bergeronii TaxID=1871336 RepID=A0A371IIY0_9FIRM|nr:universal stress protein [Criibacterium bergeronii]RDY20436.1 universal stress protein [Criibacterium bergeronii]